MYCLGLIILLPCSSCTKQKNFSLPFSSFFMSSIQKLPQAAVSDFYDFSFQDLSSDRLVTLELCRSYDFLLTTLSPSRIYSYSDQLGIACLARLAFNCCCFFATYFLVLGLSSLLLQLVFSLLLVFAAFALSPYAILCAFLFSKSLTMDQTFLRFLSGYQVDCLSVQPTHLTLYSIWLLSVLRLPVMRYTLQRLVIEMISRQWSSILEKYIYF